MTRLNRCRHENQHIEGGGVRWCSDCGRKHPERADDQRTAANIEDPRIEEKERSMYNGSVIENTLFAIFANGTYQGTWDAESDEAAAQQAADELGTDGNTDGLRAFEVSADEYAAIEAWWEDGAPAGEVPACIEY